MHRERLEVLAEWLEGGGRPTEAVPVAFDMATSLDDGSCGTVGCIGGAAIVAFASAETVEAFQSEWSAWHMPASVLGLDADSYRRLFTPAAAASDGVYLGDRWPRCYAEIDAAWAGRTIRHLLATGRVDWHATAEVRL